MVLFFLANAICVHDDYTLVLMTLREKTGCQQTRKHRLELESARAAFCK